jgi:hypothetical protein
LSKFEPLYLASRHKGLSGFAKLPPVGSSRFNMPGESVAKPTKPDPNTSDLREEKQEIEKLSHLVKMKKSAHKVNSSNESLKN